MNVVRRAALVVAVIALSGLIASLSAMSDGAPTCTFDNPGGAHTGTEPQKSEFPYDAYVEKINNKYFVLFMTPEDVSFKGILIRPNGTVESNTPFSGEMTPFLADHFHGVDDDSCVTHNDPSEKTFPEGVMFEFNPVAGADLSVEDPRFEIYVMGENTQTWWRTFCCSAGQGDVCNP